MQPVAAAAGFQSGEPLCWVLRLGSARSGHELRPANFLLSSTRVDRNYLVAGCPSSSRSVCRRSTSSSVSRQTDSILSGIPRTSDSRARPAAVKSTITRRSSFASLVRVTKPASSIRLTSGVIVLVSMPSRFPNSPTGSGAPSSNSRITKYCENVRPSGSNKGLCMRTMRFAALYKANDSCLRRRFCLVVILSILLGPGSQENFVRGGLGIRARLDTCSRVNYLASKRLACQ
jgi:hypothetical protein